MTSRKVSLLLASLVLATAGVGTAFAGDKAGAVNVTGSSACENGGAQDNTIAAGGNLYVWLHDPFQFGAPVSITSQKSKQVQTGFLLNVMNPDDTDCVVDGWALYLVAGVIGTIEPGLTTVIAYDRHSGAKIGGDSFKIVLPAN